MRIHPFRDGDVHRTFRRIAQKTIREIDGLESDYVLKASLAELEEHYASKVRITPLSLSTQQYYIDTQEGTQIDVSHDIRYGGLGDERITVKGTVLHIAVPFTGDPDLWRIRPSTFSISGYPELEIREGIVVFSCRFLDDSPEPERLKNEIERAVKSLGDAVATLASDVAQHNRGATQQVREAIDRKLTKAKAAVDAVASLGIPIRQKAAPETFVVPTRKRKSPVSRPLVPTEQFTRSR